MKLFRDNYTALLITLSVILLLAANTVLGVVLTSQSKNAMKILIQNRMTDISKTAAAMLDGDELKTLTKDDADTAAYKNALKTLTYFQDNIELEYIYCIQPPVDGQFVFSVDPTVEDPGEFGSPIVTTEALKKAAAGVTSVDEEPYNDAWGSFYSAYSPVFASDGSLAGIVAVDFSAKWYEDEIAKQEQTILICVALALFMCILLIFSATRQLRERVKKMAVDIKDLSLYVDELTAEFSTDEDFAKNPTHEVNAEDLSGLGDKIHLIKDTVKKYVADINLKAANMINALSSDYGSVYYADLDTDEAICYQATKDFPIELKAGDKFTFSNAMKAYAEYFVKDEYKEDFYKFVSSDNIKEALAKKRIITHVYLENIEGREVYKTVRIASAGRNADERVNTVVFGFTDIDEETRKTLDRNDALNNALEAARSANLAKTTFLSNMSHEIRTPMNAIIGLNAIALSHDNLAPETREQLEKVDASAKHLLSIINDILDVSRIESGKVTTKKEEFSLKEVLEQVNVIIGGQCKAKGLVYECETNSNNGYYIGDAMKIRQSLINILGNSVKFTDKGGKVSLKVDEATNSNGESTLIFVMSDTGAGMSEEFLPKLFEAFSQENDNNTNPYGSTGLGMTITKNFVELMGGTIEVQSKLGVGTTFTVTLTLPKVSSAEEEQATEEETTQDANNLAGKRILVAEDVPVNAEIALAILEMGEMKGEIAENGEIAIKMFKEHEANYYAAILMDMRMPVMDGLTATKELRALDRPDAKTIPIIALTANAFEEDVKHSLQAGVNAHLSKPINPDEIFKTLSKLVK